MKLSEQQSDFLWMVHDLLTWVHPIISTSDVILKVVEWNRTIETQRKYLEKRLTRTLRSKHLQGLAVDFAVIKNGKYLTSSPVYDLMGIHWQNIGGKWGGEWDGEWDIYDPYHFQYNIERRQKVREP